MVLERLHERIRALHPELDPTIDGTAVSLGGDRIRLSARVEAVLRDGADWIVDVRVEVAVGGRPVDALAQSVVGIGTDRDAAERQAADDWMGSIGYALLGAEARRDPVLRLARVEVYPGLPGSTTPVPEGWLDGSDPLHARILRAIASHLDTAGPDPWTTVTLFYMDDLAGRPSADCRVGGKRSESCSAALGAVEWPETEEPYMLKQVYVLRGTS